MAWKAIGKIGAFCVMTVFLATGAMGQDADFRADVIEAFTAAGRTDLIPFVQNPNNTDGEIWQLYVNTVSQPATGPLCVESPAINVTC